MIKFSSVDIFSEGLAAIKCKSKWGFINQQGDLQIPCQYDNALMFMNGKAPIKRNGKWGYIDREGNEIIECTFNKAYHFSDAVAPVKQGKLWGIIDEAGREVVSPKYEEIGFFSENIASAKFNGKYGVIDIKGNIVLPFTYKDIEFFHSGIAYARMDTQHGYINSQGDFVLELSSKQSTYPCYQNKFIPVRNGNSLKSDWSIYSNKGDLLISSLKYFLVEPFSEGYAPVWNKKDKWGLINTQGEEVIPCEYEEIIPVFNNCLFLRRDKKYAFLNLGSKIPDPFIYKDVGTFYGGVAFVNSKRWNVQAIDINGKTAFYLEKEFTLKNVLKYIYYLLE